MTASFGTLFGTSLQRVRTCMLPVLITALITAAVSIAPTAIFPELERANDEWSMLFQLDMEEEVPAEAAVPLTREQRTTAIALSIAGVIVSMVLGMYLLIAVVGGHSDPLPPLRLLPRLLFPLLGTSIWVVVLSYVWVPVLPAIGLIVWDVVQFGMPTPTSIGVAMLLIGVGIIISLIRTPRLMFAPIILIREGTGIHQSVQLSIQRTRGHWGKIVLCFLAFGVITFFVSMVLAGVFSTLFVGLSLAGQTGTISASFAMVFVQIVVSAWNQAFQTDLALTIFENPKA